jgi:hypothetical protein
VAASGDVSTATPITVVTHWQAGLGR